MQQNVVEKCRIQLPILIPSPHSHQLRVGQRIKSSEDKKLRTHHHCQLPDVGHCWGGIYTTEGGLRQGGGGLTTATKRAIAAAVFIVAT